MMETADSLAATRYFFVDEAGDGTVFDRRGNVIIGTEGCSRYFLLGLLDVAEPERLSREMTDLRSSLLADPYFKNVPSMQSPAQKTALAFHAKDDLPEVRREVFRLLQQHNLRFYAAVRDKSTLPGEIVKRRKKTANFRYHPNYLYDGLVQKIFYGLLHKYNAYHICFSRRGNSDRNAALRLALEQAQRRTFAQAPARTAAPLDVVVRSMREQTELQAVDYFLWTLQRFYERQEERYLELLWPAYRSVCYIGEGKETRAGLYYTQTKPLTRAIFDTGPQL